jgi:putative membrane protein
MKTLVLIFILGIFAVVSGCQNRETGFDGNAAEGPGIKRKNSQTNEEVSKDTASLAKVARSADETATKGDHTEPAKTTPSRHSPDREFIVQAAEAGLTEVKLGTLASEKARSPEVKKFAQMMVKDHSAANEELKKLVETRGLTLPEECQHCQDKYNELKTLKGRDFDKKYTEMMVADHKDAVTKFATETETGADPDITKWAVEKLPVLKHHLSTAESMDKQMAKGKADR